MWSLDISEIIDSSLNNSESYYIVFEIYFILAGFSSIFVILINADRYAAICHPYKYLQYATAKLYAASSLCACLTYAVLISISFVVDRAYSTASNSIIIIAFISFATLSLMHCSWKVALVTRRHRREIAAVERSSGRQHSGYRHETKRYRVILFIGILFVLCKIPHITTRILSFIPSAQSTDVLMHFALVSNLFLLLNSLLNPLIYLFRMKVFRKAMKEVLCCKTSA